MKSRIDSDQVTLEALLKSREARAEFQRTLLKGYGLPLVSLTVNMPGPVKRSGKSRLIFEAGVLALREALAGSIRYSKLRDLPTGFEGYFVVDSQAEALKAITADIEGRHPLGRLLDADVLDVGGGAVSRESLGLPPRGCLVCGAPGPGCARSRAHTVEELHRHMDSLLAGWAFGV